MIKKFAADEIADPIRKKLSPKMKKLLEAFSSENVMSLPQPVVEAFVGQLVKELNKLLQDSPIHEGTLFKVEGDEIKDMLAKKLDEGEKYFFRLLNSA